MVVLSDGRIVLTWGTILEQGVVYSQLHTGGGWFSNIGLMFFDIWGLELCDKA